MKRIILLVFVCLSFYSFSQNPELDDNTWYLQNVVINGEDNIPPVNAEISEVTLDFFYQGSDFQTMVCNGLYADLSFDDNYSNFSLTTTGQTLIVCGITENAIYENLYFGFYYNNQSNSFSYTITSTSNTSTLTVSAANGDQAIYGRARLHAKEFRMADLKTYPNPIIDELFIENQNNDNLNISVYNINGQLIHSESVSHEQSVINVSELKSGIYFFVFEGGNFKKEIRKIIKQ